MAEVNNPIKTSDLLQDDGAIDKLIADLEKLRDKYVKSIDEIQKKANTLDQSLRKLSGTTDEQKRAAQDAAVEADRLSRAYKEMKKEAAALESEIIALRRQKSELTSATQSEAKATQAEAKSIKELSDLVESVAGARGDLLEQMVREQAVLTHIKKERKDLTKAEKEGRISSEDAIAKRAQLLNTETQYKISLQQTRSQLNANTKQLLAANGSYDEGAQLLERLRMTYRRLGEDVQKSPLGVEMLRNIELLDAKVKKADASMGNFQRNVGNYASGFSPLQFQVQQVARELPSLTMSLRQFFLAISNNIPMLIDEMQRARIANEALLASGQKGVPVWKQLLRSIVSWQTLLVVGITLVTAYGKEIGNFVKELFSGKQALDSAAKSQEIFNKAMADGTRDAQKDIVRLDGLYNAVTNVSLSMDKRRIALKKLKDEYPDYLKGMSDEQILAGKAVDTYEKLRVKLLELAQARAAEKMIEQNQSYLLTLEQTGNALTKYSKALTAYGEAGPIKTNTEVVNGRVISVTNPLKQELDKTAKTLKESLEKLDAGDLWERIETDYSGDVNEFIKTIEASNKKLAEAAQSLYTTIEPGITDGGTNGNGGKETSGMTPEQKANALSLKLQKEYEQSRIDQMQESAAKRRAKIENDAEWEINELTQKYAKMEGIDKEGSEVFEQYWNQIENIERKKTEDLVQLDLDYALETRRLTQETLQNRLAAVQEGSAEYIRIQREMLENARQIELLENKARPKEQRQDESVINAKYRLQSGRQGLQAGISGIDTEFAVRNSEIEALKATEREKTVLRLQAEKERWEKVLAMMRQYSGVVSDADVAIVKNAIAETNNELEKAKRPRDFWDVVGINLDDEKKQAISESVSFALEQMTAILDAEIEMAQQAVDAANERVSAAQSALDAEMQAKANGLAYSQTEAEKRLAMEKQNQAKAIAEQKKAQKQKAQIETLQQISSLVTASAAIWGALVLPWLAIPAIAIMWATFGAAKIKASQLAKSSNGTEQYGDGTYEFIDGGSHQSGNDVPLGINPKTGKERRVEGGEMFAVVNKAGVRKYRSELPMIINSLNRGEFDRTYIRAAFAAQPTPVVVNAMGDNRKMADDIAAIRRLSERQVYTDAKGRTVIRYKNLIRKIN
nr:MAG TPA: tail length tape measure protein [Caudoviricetes sp.]